MLIDLGNDRPMELKPITGAVLNQAILMKIEQPRLELLEKHEQEQHSKSWVIGKPTIILCLGKSAYSFSAWDSGATLAQMCSSNTGQHAAVNWAALCSSHVLCVVKMYVSLCCCASPAPLVRCISEVS
ncbi:hypothetical protein BY996DRAFT_6415381 [Phakopsora pachyrhizi]|nr:hypothetical protein BY996DRAFT_6427960 [Phakopsora pachyrhizi]KAI8452575.1 hypothetical protein BY996DRAFT_6415381 [Phakopsora pachyrhizi]